MPFKSQAQARYMFSQHPEIAKEFAAATPSIKALPDHVESPADKKKRVVAAIMAKKKAPPVG